MAQVRFRIVAPLTALLLTLALTGVASASNVATFQVGLTGSQEVTQNPFCAPPDICGDPDAAGIATIKINPGSDLVCFKLQWSDIDGTVTAAHIHGPATRSQAAPVLVTFFQPASFAGTDKANGCTHDADADAIAATPTMYYVNVHSNAYPMGAIRGQLA